ncbi:Kelch repeat-containing protein [Pseudoduganella sp. OTU4001]|uniref:Kelch repeat-containing protein n=1 Tax=Pseudoduganella sp. OTU4001 TaxID=3043854 RepID=UPI00313E414F
MGAALVLAALAAQWVVEPIQPMAIARAVHQAALVGDGRLLVIGGCAANSCDSLQSSNEFYDIAQRRFRPGPAMRIARVSHSIAPLPDGGLLVVGGWSGRGATASTEIFDARASAFVAGPAMAVPRLDAAVVALGSGRVLVAGGASALNQPVASAEIYDVAAKRFAPAAPLTVPRNSFAAVRLADGRVLLAGGLRAKGTPIASAEVFDPRSGRFTAVAGMSSARYKHAAVLLRDGRVLVIGGSAGGDERQQLASTELFDPKTNTFSPGPQLLEARYKIPSSAVVLADGSVMIAGGAGDVEVWRPGARGFERAAGSLGAAWQFGTATALPSGEVLVLGGYDQAITPTRKAWLVRRQ